MAKKRKLEVRSRKALGGKLGKSSQAAKDFLDKVPVDVVYDSREMAAELNYSLAVMQRSLCNLGSAYRYIETGGLYLYGNPKTVKLKLEGAYDE